MHQFLVAVFNKRKLISQINLTFMLSMFHNSVVFFIFRILKLYKKKNFASRTRKIEADLISSCKKIIDDYKLARRYCPVESKKMDARFCCINIQSLWHLAVEKELFKRPNVSKNAIYYTYVSPCLPHRTPLKWFQFPDELRVLKFCRIIFCDNIFLNSIYGKVSLT